MTVLEMVKFFYREFPGYPRNLFLCQASIELTVPPVYVSRVQLLKECAIITWEL